jgi:hypothetical protein
MHSRGGAVIGRAAPLRGFDTIRWAREMSAPRESRSEAFRSDPRAAHGLKPLHAHLLLLLATYSDADRTAWPSIRTLAERSGYKVTERRRRDGTSRGYHCSAVSAALDELQSRSAAQRSRARHGLKPNRPNYAP